MSKRAATSQITKDSHGEQESSNNNFVNGPLMASESIMRQRKIAIPKKKSNDTGNAISGNAFNSISPSQQFNSLVFSSMNASELKHNNHKNNDKETIMKLKALNLQLKDKIIQTLDSDPFINLLPFFDKYKTFYSNIHETTSTSTSFTNISSSIEMPQDKSIKKSFDAHPKLSSYSPTEVSESAPSTKLKYYAEPNSELDGNDADVDIKGPKFTVSLKPTNNNSIFSFRPKNESLYDGNNEVVSKIEGPKFSFSGTLSSDVFKLKKDSRQESVSNKMNLSQRDEQEVSLEPTNKVSEVNVINATVNTEDIKKPIMDKIIDNLPVESIPVVNNKNNEAQHFITDKSSKIVESSKSLDFKESFQTVDKSKTFTFGEHRKAKNELKDSTFGISVDKHGEPQLPNFNNPTEVIKETKVFTFGKVSNATEKSKGLILDKPSQTKEEVKIFDPNNSLKVKDGPNLFSFNKSSEHTEGAKPFVFGKSSEAAEETKTFIFGKPSEHVETSKGFNFGKPSENMGEKKAFTFDNPSKTTGEIKAITFGSSFESTQKSKGFTFTKSSLTKEEAKTTIDFKPETKDLERTEKSKFVFGSSSVPSFTFIKPNQDTISISVPGTSKISSNLGTNDSPVTSLVEVPKTESVLNQDNENTISQHVEQTNDEPFHLLNACNGEEEEKVLFSHRAKLMLLNSSTGSYESRGVGELKVLQKINDKSKARLLCRTDGMNHIILNTSIIKSFQYNPIKDKENFVKCPVASDGKIDTYVIRVKQDADGRRLCKAISDAQGDM